MQEFSVLLFFVVIFFQKTLKNKTVFLHISHILHKNVCCFLSSFAKSVFEHWYSCKIHGLTQNLCCENLALEQIEAMVDKTDTISAFNYYFFYFFGMIVEHCGKMFMNKRQNKVNVPEMKARLPASVFPPMYFTGQIV